MSVTMTVHECTVAELGLQRISEIRLPAKTAYHIAKLLRLVKAEVKTYQEERNKFIMEIGTKRPPNEEEASRGVREEVTEVLPERRKEFVERDEEMLKVEVTIEWKPLQMSQLPDEMTGADLFSLGSLVVEDDPAPASPGPPVGPRPV